MLLFIREQILAHVVRRKARGDQVFSRRRRSSEERAILKRHGRGTVICELQGSLFFGTADQLLGDLERDLPACERLILDLLRVRSFDFTAARVFDNLATRLAEQGGHLVLCSVPRALPSGLDVQGYLDALGLVGPDNGVRVLGDLDEALEWAEERILERERGSRDDAELPLALHQLDLFAGRSPDTIADLAAFVTERAYEPGERSFSLDDEGDELLLVRRGRFQLSIPLADGTRHLLATVTRGDFFGDVTFLDGGRRTADATASTRVDLYVLSRRRFELVAADHPKLARQVFADLARVLCQRLRQADAEVLALRDS